MADNSTYTCHLQPNQLSNDLFPVFVGFGVLLSCVSTVSNSVLLLVILRDERLQSVSNLFMCSLVASDLLAGLLGIPIAIVFTKLWLQARYRDHPLLVTAHCFFLMFSPTASSLNVSVMSLDRYIAVKWPLKYPLIMTKKKCAFIVGFLWLANLGFALCIIFTVDILWSTSFNMARGLLLMFIPMVATLYCNIQIFRIARQHISRVNTLNRQISNTSTSTFSHGGSQMTGNHGNRKAAVTLGIITFALLLTFIPNFGSTMATKKLCSVLASMENIWHITVFLLYSSCAFNPLVYGTRNRDVRIAVKRLVRSAPWCWK